MARIIKPLSPMQVKNAKAQEKTYTLFDGGGLYLEITPDGSKLWRLKYRVNNKAKLLSFGKYPDVSLEQARRNREDAKKLIAVGMDPLEVRKEQKNAELERDTNTFEKIAREWHHNHLNGWRPQTAREILNRLGKDISPEIGHLSVTDITHKQLIDTLRKIESRGAHEIAKRQKANCSRIFSYAIQRGLTDRNIASDLTDILQPVRKGHFAVITTDELPAFLKAMNQNGARLYMPR